MIHLVYIIIEVLAKIELHLHERPKEPDDLQIPSYGRMCIDEYTGTKILQAICQIRNAPSRDKDQLSQVRLSILCTQSYQQSIIS
jgi:hypothetical protein